MKTFIREVILYDDRIIITYHFSERYDEHKITPESVKGTERQVAKPAFSLILGSYNLANPAPRKDRQYACLSVAQKADVRVLRITAGRAAREAKR